MIAVFTNEDETIIVGLYGDGTIMDDGALFKNGRDIESFSRRDVNTDLGEVIIVTPKKATIKTTHIIPSCARQKA